MCTSRTYLPGLAVVLAAMFLTIAAPAISATAPPTPPPVPVPPILIDTTGLGLSYVTKVTFGRSPCDGCPPRVCPNEGVLVTVSGSLPDGCVRFRGLHELAVATPFPVLLADFVVDSCNRVCSLSPEPFVGQVELPPAPPGLHELQLRVGVRVCPDTLVTSRAYARMSAYEVLADCHVEPRLDSLVRTFSSLRVRPEHPCPGDSLTLEFDENGCPPCVHLVSLGEDPFGHLRAVLEWRPHCFELACVSDTLTYALGRFLAGSHGLSVAVDVHVLDTAAADSTISYKLGLAFVVPRVCDTTFVGCLHSPLPPYGTPIPECSVRVPPGGRGDVLLPVRNDLAGLGVAGVEGVVTTTPPFRIVDLHYAGAATGVHLSWRQNGAFVLFGSTPDVVPSGTSDLLRVTVMADSVILAETHSVGLSGRIRVASGPNGEAVPLCPELFRSIPPQLRLCLGSSALGCDVNADGHADVRDLVLMARCLRHVPDDTLGSAACFDCDGDGTFGIPDLFCCAHEILHGPGVPHDSSHVQAGLTVSMDAPSRDGDAVRVRLHVRGASSLGAALLRLRYPADRWQLPPPSNLDEGFAEGWLPLVDAGEAGLLRLGALRLADAAADELVYELRAVPLAGTEQSGILSVEGADLTAPDGGMLSPASPLPSAELSPTGPATVVELSPASPNPFTHSTTFAISLPRDSEVDLTVHDLAGRRVATLAHGRFGAGRREFTWNGAGAHDGVYFVRLTVDGSVLSTRAALLRGGR